MRPAPRTARDTAPSTLHARERDVTIFDNHIASHTTPAGDNSLDVVAERGAPRAQLLRGARAKHRRDAAMLAR